MDMLRYLLNSGLALMAGLEEHRVSVTLKQWDIFSFLLENENQTFIEICEWWCYEYRLKYIRIQCILYVGPAEIFGRSRLKLQSNSWDSVWIPMLGSMGGRESVPPAILGPRAMRLIVGLPLDLSDRPQNWSPLSKQILAKEFEWSLRRTWPPKIFRQAYCIVHGHVKICHVPWMAMYKYLIWLSCPVVGAPGVL